MTELEKDFYSQLGLLSTKYAHVEADIMTMLSLLITEEHNAVIGLTLLERNTLETNLQLLKKVDKIRAYESEKVANIIEKVRSIKADRNLFIHGLWVKPYVKDDEPQTACVNKRIRYTENGGMKMWQQGTIHKFTLKEVEKRIKVLDEILDLQEEYIDMASEYLWDNQEF